MQLKTILISSLLLFSFNLISQINVNIIQEGFAKDELIFFSNVSSDSYLLDKCGNIIRNWEHNGTAGLTGRLTHDGKLLRAEAVSGCCAQASTGGLLELYDMDTNLEWSYKFANNQYTQHHDFHYMPNGNILFIGWEIVSADEKEALGKLGSGTLWGEFIYEIKPTGTNTHDLIWEWHLKDHLVQDVDPTKSNYVKIDTAIGKVDINYRGPTIFSTRDWWHANAIHYNEERDEILLNTRSNCETWILDHSTTTEEAKSDAGGNRGKGGQILFRWGNPHSYERGSSSDRLQYGSHGHHWIDKGLPNEGKILFFNNGDSRPQGYYSTVEMIEPAIDADGNYIVENFQHKIKSHDIIYGKNQQQERLISKYLSNAQQLENGNFLINEGNEGRIFEIDSDNNIIWQIKSSRDLFRAYNYKTDYEGFTSIDKESIYPTPEPQSITVESGGSVNISVPGNTINWFTTETATTSFLTNNFYSINNVTESITYWVADGRFINGSTACLSERVPIEIIVDGVSTNDIKQEELTIYPNPATHSFSINNLGSLEGLTILNLNGQSQEVVKSNSNYYDVSHLSPGMYIIELIVDHKPVIRKLLVH